MALLCDISAIKPTARFVLAAGQIDEIDARLFGFVVYNMFDVFRFNLFLYRFIFVASFSMEIVLF